MLAYSSIAQVGYMLLGIGMTNVTGLTAALLHLFNHALMKGALFLSLGALCFRIGNTALNNMHGIGRQMPWTMAAFVLGGFSIIGIPLTAGFVSKWYLVLAALERAWWPIVIVILVASLISVVYIWRVVEIAYLSKPKENIQTVSEAPLSLLIPTWALVLANLYFGIDTSMTIRFANGAALTLFGSH
jgi:multicomponent Na+:H+ antiporter subunit D